MVSERLKLDEKESELEVALKNIDWSKFLQYGSIKITVRHGRLKLITKEETKLVED